ncbi:MAG: ABC transporter permease [Holophagales bacterium]|nr:ABC transporter permease [Holophagales bacterium]
MPIYTPKLPPIPNLAQRKPPILSLARFDLMRILRQKLGRFFGAVFVGILLIQLTVLYTKYLIATNSQLDQVKGLADHFLPKSADFQASLLHPSMLWFLWFQVALIGGGLISRDTLYRIRPLIFAHPVRPLEYLASKTLIAFGVPFCIQLPFIIVPWLLSMLVAGPNGPVWLITPLYLIPAAILNSMLMASITLGASSLAGTPKAGMGWVIGLLLGPSILGGILTNIFNEVSWMALSPIGLTQVWPRILCGATKMSFPLWPTIIATAANILLWLYIAKRRTMPSEAVI